jgi:DNA invertase Pin-like site-specific DNA recombinase
VEKVPEIVFAKSYVFVNTPGMTATAPKTAASVPVAILVRVSTLKQETDRQVSELREYADRKGYTVVEVCAEQVSGRADEADRHGLQRVEELVRAGKVKKVLVHEVSRLARKNSVVHRFVEALEERGVSLYWHGQGVETLLESGKRNPAAAIMLALLAEMARNAVETLSTRIRSGLEEARRKGRKLGRPEGGESPAELLNRHRDIVRLLNAGLSIRHTAKIAGKGVPTVQRVKEAMAA